MSERRVALLVSQMSVVTMIPSWNAPATTAWGLGQRNMEEY
jgi:hypothetical protein